MIKGDSRITNNLNLQHDQVLPILLSITSLQFDINIQYKGFFTLIILHAIRVLPYAELASISHRDYNTVSHSCRNNSCAPNNGEVLSDLANQQSRLIKHEEELLTKDYSTSAKFSCSLEFRGRLNEA